MKNNWKSYAARTYALEKRFIPKLTRIIKAYRTNFIRDLQTYGQSTATNNLQKSLAPYELTKAVHSIYRVAGLMGAKNQVKELNDQLTPKDRAQIAVHRRSRLEQKAGFGRGESWIAEVLSFLNTHLLAMVQNITETMRGDIIRILKKAVDEGLSIETIVAELKKEGLIVSRAKVIARTEINKATNKGHEIGARSLPYEVDKGWSAANDEKTRRGHMMTHGHWTDENGLFNVPIYNNNKYKGTEEMTGPGDPEASKENVVNCRCRKIYKPKRDSNGRLIMRTTNQATVIPMRQVPRLDPAQVAAQLKSLAVITVDEK